MTPLEVHIGFSMVNFARRRVYRLYLTLVFPKDNRLYKQMPEPKPKPKKKPAKKERTKVTGSRRSTRRSAQTQSRLEEEGDNTEQVWVPWQLVSSQFHEV